MHKGIINFNYHVVFRLTLFFFFFLLFFIRFTFIICVSRSYQIINNSLHCIPDKREIANSFVLYLFN